MGSSERAPIDAATIRQTYTDGLDVWGHCPPELKKPAQLRDRLIGHVQLLVPEVTDVAARMRGETRRVAVHVIVRAHHLIEEGAGNSPAAQACSVQDLAVIARALLVLHENPGPLGPPTRRSEIEEAVRRKVCGACWQPIADGEGYERAVFASDSGAGIRGYLHTDSCSALADVRRGQLRTAS
ncbi:DUF6415 family natural product biosynthesis protein [Streptomyces iakyrus]|uniref:DUF6415 family natural product biosynthesis protein n=1 Tax=Streptomyces iakyrus TaxID=68219 RepID=UPI000527A237|nr:DUF6415 family natural product biosynthesis protein [Streptomyces iakyrus]